MQRVDFGERNFAGEFRRGVEISTRARVLPRHWRRRAPRRGLESLPHNTGVRARRLQYQSALEWQFGKRRSLEEWRHRTIEGIGYGTNQLGFAWSNDAVECDGLGARREQVLFDLGNGLTKAVERLAEAWKIALGRRKQRYLGASSPG